MATRRRKNPVLTVVTNPPAEMSDDVHFVGYRHAVDGEDYIHEFGPGVTMRAKPNGSVELRQTDALPLHEEFRGGRRFLINPPRRAIMAARKQARYTSGPNKGRFKKNPGRSRARTVQRRATTATRKRAKPRARSVAAPARRRRRRNPPKMSIRSITRDLTKGSVDAALILVGKAATRTVPAMIPNIPKQGNMGLAVQALTAVAVAIVAQQVLKPDQARMILAGGLSAPVETLVVSMDVPFLADALAPVTGDQQLSAYLGAYVQPELQLAPGESIGAYVQEGADLALAGYDYAAHM